MAKQVKYSKKIEHWHTIEIYAITGSPEHSQWVRDNIKGKYAFIRFNYDKKPQTDVYCFENSEDAILYKLIWGSKEYVDNYHEEMFRESWEKVQRERREKNV